MHGVTLLLLGLGWLALLGLVSGDILGHGPAGVGPAGRPSGEAVQLQISIPIAADQLLQLASASPDAWRQILAQTPPAARRSLLAQLTARRQDHAAGHDPRRADSRRAARRSYSTLEADGSGYRRLARRERPSSKYGAPTRRSRSGYRTTVNDLDRPSSSYGPPSREPARPSSSYRPPATDFDRPASSYSSPSGVFDGSSSEYRSPSDSFRSSVSRYRPSAASASPETHSRYTPPASRYESSSSSRGASLASYATPRPAAPRVTTYRPPRQGYSAPEVGPASSGYGGEHGQEELQGHDGLEWLRDVVPGLPGEDYPVLGSIPLTSFSCAGRPEGYFTDVATRCQVYHVCHGPFRMSSFLCPNGTVFSQSLATCDWWFNTECSEDLPLPSSTFREGRHMSGYMFEDDWIDDYEDFDAADYRPPANSYRPPAKSYRPPPPRDSRRSPGDSHRSSVDSYRSSSESYRSSGESSTSYRQPASRPADSYRSLPDERRAARDDLRSSYSSFSASSTTEQYRLPDRRAASRAPQRRPPSSERNRDYTPPGGNDGHYEPRSSETFLATLRAPASRQKLGEGVKTKPFIIRVTYGGKRDQGRTTKELKFGPRAAEEFLSRAQIRRWSFNDEDPIARRLAVAGSTEGTSELRASATHVRRALEKARDKAFDFEVGRRQGRTLETSESRIRPRTALTALLQDVVDSGRSSPGFSRTTFVRPPPTRPMVRPVEQVAPPESSVEPPTVADAVPSGVSRFADRGVTAVQDGYDQNNPFNAERSTTLALVSESQREQSVRDGRTGGKDQNYSFDGRTLGESDGSVGSNEIAADFADFDYDGLLTDKSFKEFGLRIPKELTEATEHRSPGESIGHGVFSRPFKALARFSARAEDWNPRDFTPWATSEDA